MNKKIISFLVFFIALIPACYAQLNQEEKDGFKWSKTWKGKFVVAYDEFGNEIIPASKGFNYINYEPNPDGDSYGYFRVQKGSKYGAYDVMGNEVIPPVSKYPYTLKNRDSNVYQDYEGQLSSMKTFPERYDDQQRRSIQMKMKQIRTKWEQKGFKMYHSEWENWDGSH